MTLVDTNVIVDILAGDPMWMTWSTQQLSRCRDSGSLRINEITCGELAVRIKTEADLHRGLAGLDIELELTPTSALFIAGKAFGRYRAAGGARTSLLPDFFIGAHGQFARLPLLPRDARRYRVYFSRRRSDHPVTPQRVNFLYFSRCGMMVSVPRRRILSAS